jgi:undecaprenyl diphosphate synthase
LDIMRLPQNLVKRLTPVLKGEKLLETVRAQSVPVHIAIIMDGNGRWAKRRGLPRQFGHKAGVDTIRNVVKWANEIEVKVLTLYAFSTENWQRPKVEVDFLMRLPVDFLETELQKLLENNIKLQVLGEAAGLPPHTQEAVYAATQKTANNSGLILNLAFNYGSRAEILRAVKIIAKETREGKISPEDVDEGLFQKYLYTCGLPDPDLLIRPSGELRLSNFLLWQLAYTEFWFSNTLWPDFSRDEFLRAVLAYQKRDRRFGGIKF